MDANEKYQSQSPGKGGAAASAFGVNRNIEREEDLPPLRAVSLRNQPVALQISSGSDGIKDSNQQDSFLSLNKSSTRVSDGQSAKVVATRREWKECNWQVSLLNEVPLNFHLERTRREIEKLSVTEVVDRITNSLRVLSIEAEFDGQNAKAKCKTSDMVGFRIRLFAGDSKTQEPIIVEIQRRSGALHCFMHVCKKILDAAEGVEIQPESVPARKKMPSCTMKTPVCGMKCLENIDTGVPQMEVVTGINKSLEMLRSTKKDINVLGLKNLCSMADPLKTRPDVAIMACKEMLVGQFCKEVRDMIVLMLKKDAFLAEEDRIHPFRDLLDRRRHLTLVLLSDVLALTSQDGCLESAVKNQQWFTKFLIPSLLYEVKRFEISSNNAYEAACGLTSLATCSDIAKKVMVDNSAIDDLETAYQFAIYNHYLLESETRRSLQLLGNPP